MATPTDLHIVRIEQKDPRLGRHVVHDPASWGFAAPVVIDKSRWRTVTNTIFDPLPNPNQTIGDCTGCQKAMAFNAGRWQRKNAPINVPLDMSFADKVYSLATQLDPFDGTYPPDDTGSSGLAACKAAQQLGLGGAYHWYFGIDQVVQGIIDGNVIGLGTEWTEGMFKRRRVGTRFVIEPTGAVAGGHEYTARGYNVDLDEVLLRCWWGNFRDVWMKRTQLGEQLAKDGDAQSQVRIA